MSVREMLSIFNVGQGRAVRCGPIRRDWLLAVGVVSILSLGGTVALADDAFSSLSSSPLRIPSVKTGLAELDTTNRISSVQPPALLSQGGPASSTGSADGIRLPDELEFIGGGPEKWTSPEGLSSSLQVMLLLTVLSLAPAVLLMTTCYVRIVIVLGLLRQAIGLQSLPPSQVMTSIALFMTLFVMTPVWTAVYDDAIEPYTDPGISMGLQEAFEAGSVPIRKFMSRQIDVAGNQDDIFLFYQYMDAETPAPSSYADVPLRVLLPAFILSELKTAFLMGFQIYLPFLIVDLVVASVTVSMGMMMLPPAAISIPFKLLLFVLVDGWRLVVNMLMESFGTIGM